MSKSKINLKFWVLLFGLVMLAGLIPLGIQALATDEAAEPATPAVDPAAPAVDPGAPAVDPGCPNPEPAAPAEATAPAEGEPAAPANEYTIEVTVDTSIGELFWVGKELEEDPVFTLQEGEEVVKEEPYNHVGRLSIKKADGSKMLIAEAVANSNEECYKFSTWTESYNVETGVTTYGADFETYDPTEDGAYYFAGQLVDGEDGTPIVGAEASWVNLEQHQTYITEYTDSLGCVCVKIPLGIQGSVHVIADGYVSDYSVPQAYTSENKPMYIYAQMIKGIVCSVVSNFSDAKFHVKEYVSNNTIHPGFKELTEDVILDEVPTRMLPDGANMVALSDEFCDKYGHKHGSLYYYFEGKMPLGASLYEIIFEPDDNYQLENWTVSDNSGNSVMTIDAEYPIVEEAGPYTYQVNYLQPGCEPIASAQTSDSVALIVAAFAGLALACAFAARRNRKLNH